MRICIFVGDRSPWTEQAIRAAGAEITRKRYTAEILTNESVYAVDFDRLYGADEKRLLLYLGATRAEAPALLSHLAANHVHGILLNFEGSLPGGRYSKILLDYHDGMEKILAYLIGCGKSSIALYGVNPNSPTDMLKNADFEAYLRAHGRHPTRDIYYNYASLSGCFDRFFEHRGDYDAVICANDIVALALIEGLRARGGRVPEDLFVVSFGSTVLGERASPSLTRVGVDHEALGVQAVLAYAFLSKDPGDVSLNLKVNATLHVGDSTAGMPAREKYDRTEAEEAIPDVNFYEDPVTRRIFDAENLLRACDELDFGILYGILDGKTYPAIAEALYASENVISYRIKRMCRLGGVAKKSELVALISPLLRGK
ncbi:MAG: substrate-binding domain-containing protein [Clostridia bacterium]|nr:substrate-binding domain-containing protein [Clostridia bacterium]